MSKITFRTYENGQWSEQELDMGEDFDRIMEEAQAEYRRLEEAGTPYWCIHKGRDVTHPKAYWKPDTYDEDNYAYDGIHGKHGVMCAECGGYIQEG